MNITVIIPTYLRSTDLERCLNGLKRQSRLPDEILVVIRDTDTDTWSFFQRYDTELLCLKTLTVRNTGVVAAMNIGLDAATGNIISFIDDDAVPHIDWLSQTEAHFKTDPDLAGVGGRDLMYQGEHLIEGEKQIVGRLQWFGRMIGNHHLGTGIAREVDILKGVNMSYRRKAIADMRFDQRMKGTGAQVHFEVAFCLSLKRAGWKLIYDPQIIVDHYLAQRFDEDRRNQFNPVAFFNEVHNETLAIVEHFSPQQRVLFALWSVLVGTKKAFGLVQLIRFLPQEGKLAVDKWLISMRGRRQGWMLARK
jgi:cellulose synthase/poly-beta-1,6-N-acetylglucosamine synthase-like glycosyltransferase